MTMWKTVGYFSPSFRFPHYEANSCEDWKIEIKNVIFAKIQVRNIHDQNRIFVDAFQTWEDGCDCKK